MERKPKTLFQLDSPFTPVQWPDISSQNQDTILELLCSLLSPINQHRTSNIIPSKGKRSNKRKRQDAKDPKQTSSNLDTPQPPEISAFVAVGLNSITRHLEFSAQKSKPSQQKTNPPETLSLSDEPERASEDPSNNKGHFVAVFVARSTQPSALHDHLPQLVVAASLAYPTCPATRLVQLPDGSEERLSRALGIPRVSFLGLFQEAPHSASLVNLIHECVAPVEIPVMKGLKYLPVKINAIQTFAPPPCQRENGAKIKGQ